ncbi:MAG: penicillin-binding protein 2 [Candidatus Moranbacteria bacterium]|nr:penicillin-binding protein 2 [Candidatus Moranbacteria bacterium]
MPRRNTKRKTVREHAHRGSERQKRVTILAFCVCLMALAIGRSLFGMQITKHEDYKAIAQQQHESSYSLTPKRGEIYMNDVDGLYPLAVNRELSTIYAVPRDVVDVEKTVTMLVGSLGVDEEEIRMRLNKREDLFEIIKKEVNQEEKEKIEQLNIEGIHTMPETYRFYPAKELLAQTVGFLGGSKEEKVGQYGLEAQWEEMLRGQSGYIRQERDASGRWIAIGRREENPVKDGVDIILSTDYPVQYEVEKILHETIEKHSADEGTIIVMRPNGEIVAMASLPSFDPNKYGEEEDMSVYLNPAINLTYEPGSIFKPLTIAMGLNEEKITPESTYVDTGSVKLSGYTIKNSKEKVYGLQTMTQVLEESINTGVIYVENLVGNERFSEYVRMFGFGEKTGIGLPGELGGNIKNLDNPNKTLEHYTASFGQGITVTPMQIIAAYATVANGGRKVTPYIVKQMRYHNGIVEDRSAQFGERIISQKVADQIGQMLESVVTSGHGQRASVEGYRVGGKTGTAQVVKEGEKGYDADATIGSFVGFAPIEKPEFVVLVKIDNPKDVIWAESSAAPTFGRVMSFLLDHYNIEPSQKETQEEQVKEIESQENI